MSVEGRACSGREKNLRVWLMGRTLKTRGCDKRDRGMRKRSWVERSRNDIKNSRGRSSTSLTFKRKHKKREKMRGTMDFIYIYGGGGGGESQIKGREGSVGLGGEVEQGRTWPPLSQKTGGAISQFYQQGARSRRG